MKQTPEMLKMFLFCYYMRALLLQCVLKIRLSRLNSLLDNNPLECDCAIMPQSFEQVRVSGTCAYPHHLRGVNISTIHAEDLQCGMFSNIIVIPRLCNISNTKDRVLPHSLTPIGGLKRQSAAHYFFGDLRGVWKCGQTVKTKTRFFLYSYCHYQCTNLGCLWR